MWLSHTHFLFLFLPERELCSGSFKLQEDNLLPAIRDWSQSWRGQRAGPALVGSSPEHRHVQPEAAELLWRECCWIVGVPTWMAVLLNLPMISLAQSNTGRMKTKELYFMRKRHSFDCDSSLLHAHTHVHARTHIHTHTHTHRSIHVHRHTYRYTCEEHHVHAHTGTRTCACTLTLATVLCSSRQKMRAMRFWRWIQTMSKLCFVEGRLVQQLSFAPCKGFVCVE